MGTPNLVRGYVAPAETFPVYFAAPDTSWKYVAATGGITNTSDVVLKTAAGAGKKNYLSSLQAVNADPQVATEIVVKDGSTVIWRGYLGPSPQLPIVPFTFNPPLQSSANAALNFACITTASKTYVNAQGYSK